MLVKDSDHKIQSSVRSFNLFDGSPIKLREACSTAYRFRDVFPQQRIGLYEKGARVPGRILDLLIFILVFGRIALMAARRVLARMAVPLLGVLGGRTFFGEIGRLLQLLLGRDGRLGLRLGRTRPAARLGVALLLDGGRLNRIHPLFHLIRDTATCRMICE